MRTLTEYLSAVKGEVLHYKRLMYYYFGYKMHNLRLAAPSNNVSSKLAAVKTNDLAQIKEKVFNGTWRVNDIVSINNMSSMLHEAVVMDRREIFEFLVRQGAELNSRDRNGMTPLLKAAALGREFLVVALVNNGVNPHHRDPNGFTALQKAILHEEWKIVDILMSLPDRVKGESKWSWPPEI